MAKKDDKKHDDVTPEGAKIDDVPPPDKQAKQATKNVIVMKIIELIEKRPLVTALTLLVAAGSATGQMASNIASNHKVLCDYVCRQP